MEKEESIKLKALSDIASIDISHEFENILQEILKITCETMNAHSATLMLVDEITDELKMVSSFGLSTDYIEKVYRAANEAGLPLSSSPSGSVFKTGKYFAVPNIYDEPKNRPWYPIAKEFGFSAQIFTPIKNGLKVIGLLNVYMEEVHDFNEEEINFVNIAASQASSVVQNARMCIRLKNNIQELNDHKEKLEEKIKEMHNALYSSERYLRTIIESSIDGIAVVDDQGKIEFGNDSFFDIVGWPRDELSGKFFNKILADDTKELTLKILDEYHNNRANTGQNTEAKIVTRDSQIRYLLISQVEIFNNWLKKFVFIARDITEKKMMEQKVNDYHKKLEQSYEELIEADRIKTEFISNITHELLTPLTSIRGFVELLDDETMGKINPEQKKSLEIILRNSNRLIKLIKELLDTLNLDNNKLGLQFRLVSVNSILSKSIQDIHPQANEKQIMIIKDIQPLPEIWGDEDRLVQVIMNLLINAIKFTPHNGKITIRAIEQIEQVKISISDTGIGIPADKLMAVFDRFYQVDGSSNRKYGGIGLGLSICKSIIDKHYGSIWAQSYGQGSTFHIILPKLRNSGRK
ncbi:MAG TPA: ATP-binding protein [Candidatus Methanoperedens sp.]|nr:ATP-binding protein [Candidatus Methanoperedens sp.]